MSNRLVLAAVLAGTVVLVAISFWALAERTEATGGNSLANPDTGIVQLTTIALVLYPSCLSHSRGDAVRVDLYFRSGPRAGA